VIPYSENRRVLEAKEFGLIISVKDYYNSVRKMIPDKDKPEIIDNLFIALQEVNFIYRCRVKVKKDKERNFISRKLR
jgi:hypothetical protein